MHILQTAMVLAEESTEATSHVSPYVFGAFSLVGLGALLFLTMMIKVGD